MHMSVHTNMPESIYHIIRHVRGHVCAEVNRKQIVFSATGCVITEITTEMVQSKTRHFFAWTDDEVEMLLKDLDRAFCLYSAYISSVFVHLF